LRLHHVAVITGDLEKSIDFYREFLGLEVSKRFKVEGNEIAFLSTGNSLIELIAPNELKGKKIDFNDNIHIAFEPEDIKQAFEKIKNAGVELKTDLTKSGEFTYCHFKGPNGETLEIIKNE